ncbi:hypothetical protein LWP45_000478 [Escherichia coli]|nr:hypothetical protein [Escherichia coli]
MGIKDESLNFLEEWSLDSALVEKSGLSIDILRSIVQDYKNNQLTLLDEAEYIAKKIQRCDSVHSVRWRIKDTSHLLNKIIRKLTESEPPEKYKGINSGNYKSIITDLIGVRAICCGISLGILCIIQATRFALHAPSVHLNSSMLHPWQPLPRQTSPSLVHT